MSFRKVLFWMHLIAGCVAGVVVLIMSVTGVMLTYERQMLARADRGSYRVEPPAGTQPLEVNDLLARLSQNHEGGLPRGSSLVMRSDPGEPVELSIGREGSVYASPYDGSILGKSNPGTRRTFQKITAWHRWLGSEGEGRATAKAITGACNLAFLFLVASGMYLWLPKVWSMRHIRPILWFKGGLSGKARDFNWHNVFGIWAAVPLLIVVASAVPMSYPWGTALVYWLAGSEAPAVKGPPPSGGLTKGGGGERRERPEGGERGARGIDLATVPALAPMWARARQEAPDWRSISMRIPEREGADIAFLIDSGDGGQPQLRSTLTLDASGAVKRVETFSNGDAGRQWRMWTRFAHTGEYYGVVGQTIAGLASLAGVFLVWTGIALALRRFSAWRTRGTRADAAAEQPQATVGASGR